MKKKKTKFVLIASSGIASLFFGLGIFASLQLRNNKIAIGLGTIALLSSLIQYFRGKKMYDQELEGRLKQNE